MQWPWPRCVEVIWSLRCERHAAADGARLLADRQVHRAVDQAARVALLGLLLETADEHHAIIGVFKLLVANRSEFWSLVMTHFS